MFEALGIGGKVVESVATYKLAGLLLGQYAGMTLLIAAALLAWKLTLMHRADEAVSAFTFASVPGLVASAVDLAILGAGIKLLFF